MSTRLTRGQLEALAVALVTVVAVAVLVGVVARGWWQGDGGSYAPPRTLVRTEVTPARSLFGQILTAHARLVVDPRRVDPQSADLAVDFKPYRVRAESHHVTGGLGRAVVVDFRYELQCLTRDCVPHGSRNGAATAVHLPRARATLRGRDGRTVSLPFTWAPFAVQSRLTADEIAFSTPHVARGSAQPPVSWAIWPGLLGGLALAAAIVLALIAGVLVVSVVRRDARPLHMLRIPGHLTPIERALVLAEHAVARGEVDESRKALERLAAELRRGDADAQALAAERLAWSEHGPSQDTVAELAGSVRSNGAR